jgi:hypothetical protein
MMTLAFIIVTTISWHRCRPSFRNGSEFRAKCQAFRHLYVGLLAKNPGGVGLGDQGRAHELDDPMAVGREIPPVAGRMMLGGIMASLK